MLKVLILESSVLFNAEHSLQHFYLVVVQWTVPGVAQFVERWTAEQKIVSSTSEPDLRLGSTITKK